MLNIKLLIFFSLLFNSFFIFSQENIRENSLFSNEIKASVIKFKEELNFNKAASSFLEKNWDTTLVYSMRQIALTKNVKLLDYCHYFRGISFKEKNLIKESKSEFRTVSSNFQFNYKVKIKVFLIISLNFFIILIINFFY